MIEMFAFGSCTALAEAMRQHTGWPYAVVKTAHSWTHLGVFTPSGDFLDIRGARPVAVAEAEHEECRIEAVSWQELVDMGALTSTAWTATVNPPIAVEMIQYLAERLADRAVDCDVPRCWEAA
jgi:hypothetical protein